MERLGLAVVLIALLFSLILPLAMAEPQADNPCLGGDGIFKVKLLSFRSTIITNSPGYKVALTCKKKVSTGLFSSTEMTYPMEGIYYPPTGWLFFRNLQTGKDYSYDYKVLYEMENEFNDLKGGLLVDDGNFDFQRHWYNPFSWFKKDTIEKKIIVKMPCSFYCLKTDQPGKWLTLGGFFENIGNLFWRVFNLVAGDITGGAGCETLKGLSKGEVKGYLGKVKAYILPDDFARIHCSIKIDVKEEDFDPSKGITYRITMKSGSKNDDLTRAILYSSIAYHFLMPESTQGVIAPPSPPIVEPGGSAVEPGMS